METPLEKLNERIEKLKANPFLSQLDVKHGIKKAYKDYHEEIKKDRPERPPLAGVTSDSRAFQQQIVDAMRGGPANDAAEATAAAMKEAVPLFDRSKCAARGPKRRH